jgi:hypothetical protein
MGFALQEFGDHFPDDRMFVIFAPVTCSTAPPPHFSVITPENGLLHDARPLYYAFSAGGRRTSVVS